MLPSCACDIFIQFIGPVQPAIEMAPSVVPELPPGRIVVNPVVGRYFILRDREVRWGCGKGRREGVGMWVSNKCVCMYTATKRAWVGIRKQLLLAE